MGKRLAQLIAVLVAVSQAQAAKGVTVRAELDRARVELGDSVGLQLVVLDSSGGGISAGVPGVNGLDIRRAGSGVRWINGRRSDILNYVVTPLREGRFVIPPVTVRVDGQTLATNQLVLVASKAPESSSMRLRASVSKRECYILEPVDVLFKWYVSSDVRGYELSIPLLEDKDRLSLKALPPTGAGEEITADRYQLRAGRATEQVEGTDYMVLAVRFRIFPPEAGVYTIGRATVRAELRSGYKTVRDDFFPVTRRAPNYEMVFAASEPSELVVKELPVEGRPDDFSGAVGKYSISLQTSDAQVKVGDPVLIKTIISGEGLLEKIKRPILSQDAAFAKNFSINESLAPGDISGDRITFEQTIRAKSEDVKEIPSLAFSYFDPERGVYEVARSKPIVITVLPTTEVTAEDVIKFGERTAGAGTTLLEEQPGGIFANYNHLDALRNQDVKWHLLSFLGLPPAVYLVTLVIVGHRRKLAGDSALARSRSARKIFRKNMAEAKRQLQGDDRQFYDTLARAISRFTSDKLNLGTGELTARDVQVLAEESKLDQGVAGKTADILLECDAGRFAPSAQSAEDRMGLLRRAEEVSKELEKAL